MYLHCKGGGRGLTASLPDPNRGDLHRSHGCFPKPNHLLFVSCWRGPLRWRLRADEDEGSEAPLSFWALWEPRVVGGVLFCVSSYCPVRSTETPSFCFCDNQVSSCCETRLVEERRAVGPYEPRVSGRTGGGLRTRFDPCELLLCCWTEWFDHRCLVGVSVESRHGVCWVWLSSTVVQTSVLWPWRCFWPIRQSLSVVARVSPLLSAWLMVSRYSAFLRKNKQAEGASWAWAAAEVMSFIWLSRLFPVTPLHDPALSLCSSL